MKKIILILVVVLLAGNIINAQENTSRTVQPLQVNNKAIANKVDPVQQKIEALEKRLTDLENENKALKEQIAKNKTRADVSFKALDYSFGLFKKQYEEHLGQYNQHLADYQNHVHYIGDYKINGFLSFKAPGTAGAMPFATASSQQGPFYSGKPKAGN